MSFLLKKDLLFRIYYIFEKNKNRKRKNQDNKNMAKI